jgi:tripartite-type tricarboxylate transporter receptor subunit TctC
MSIHRRQFVALLAAAASLRAVPAFAQNWPSRPIRLIVPFPAGGSADLSARLLAEHLKAALGQAVVVESKVGAGGNIAVRTVPRPSIRASIAICPTIRPGTLRRSR